MLNQTHTGSSFNDELVSIHDMEDPEPARQICIVEDMWAHRRETMRCGSCVWYVRKGGGSVGRCRRHSPSMSGYPVVFESGWCGDHKLDETRLT